MPAVLSRLWMAASKRPTRGDWRYAAALIAVLGVVYIPLGAALGFLFWDPRLVPLVALRLLVVPSITEELVFRVLLIESAGSPRRWGSAAFSWTLFVLSHPLNPWGKPFYSSAAFLIGAGLLGVACTLAFLRSGSLWPSVVVHWTAVSVWFLLLGGCSRF